MAQPQFQDICSECGKVIVANSRNTLTVDMAVHKKKHELEKLNEMGAEAIRVAPQYTDSSSATVVDKKVVGDFAYITTQTQDGRRNTARFDMRTGKLVDFT